MKPIPEQIKQMAIECGLPYYQVLGNDEIDLENEDQVIAFFTRAYELGWKNRGESDEQIAMNWPDDCVLDVAEAIRNNTGE